METFLYHLTRPDRARAILREGFDDTRVVPQPAHGPFPVPPWIYRTYMARKKHLGEWLRILGREYGWPKFAVLEISVPTKTWDALMTHSLDEWGGKETFLAQWGSQFFIQSRHVVRPGEFGIRIRFLKVIRNRYRMKEPEF